MGVPDYTRNEWYRFYEGKEQMTEAYNELLTMLYKSQRMGELKERSRIYEILREELIWAQLSQTNPNESRDLIERIFVAIEAVDKVGQ